MGHKYGKPRSFRDYPGGSRPSQWDAFVEDVILRLERTPGDWLAYPFASEADARSARNRLWNVCRFRRQGAGGLVKTKVLRLSPDRAVDLGFEEVQAQAALFIKRGPNWMK